MAKKKKITGNITNKRARFDYELGDSLIVGINLTGAETKSLRMGHADLRGAYVTTKDNELFLINATINGTSSVPIEENEQTRPRKLLAKKKEILNLIEAKNIGRTIVPIEILTKSRYIKLKIAIGKGRKKYDKRQVLKAKDENRQIRRQIQN